MPPHGLDSGDARARLCDGSASNWRHSASSTPAPPCNEPAVTVALGELLGAHPLGVLFGSVQGVCCLLLGSVCYAVGGAWMHRLMLAMIGAPP